MGELLELMSRLAREKRTVLAEVIGSEVGSVPAWQHWPDGGALDRQTGYRWYYHCHPEGQGHRSEHGHFHLFSEPLPRQGITHLVAVSVDGHGMPLALFAPNRWVTNERWQSAPQVLRLIARFAMTLPRGLRPIHQWLSALLQTYAIQIRALIRYRDTRLLELEQSARSNVFEDRRIQVLSRCPVDLCAQAMLLERLSA